MDEAGVAQVVKASRAEDLGTGLEPHRLAELHTVLGQELWGHAPESTEHGPAGVDDLELAVAGEGLGVGGESGGVPAVVTRELTSEVGGGVLGEGAQELGSVSAIPAQEITPNQLLRKSRLLLQPIQL